MEVAKGKWVTLIKEQADGAFSHIIEPLGIQRAVEAAANKIAVAKNTQTGEYLVGFVNDQPVFDPQLRQAMWAEQLQTMQDYLKTKHLKNVTATEEDAGEGGNHPVKPPITP